MQPDLKPIRNDKLIDTFKDEWRELSEAMDKFPIKSQQAILKQMDSQLEEGFTFDSEKGLKTFKVKDMSFKDNKVSKLPLIVREKNVQFLWVFNCCFFNLQSFTPGKCSKGFKGQTVPLQLADSGKISQLLLSKAKMQIVKK